MLTPDLINERLAKAKEKAKGNKAGRSTSLMFLPQLKTLVCHLDVALQAPVFRFLDISKSKTAGLQLNEDQAMNQ